MGADFAKLDCLARQKKTPILDKQLPAPSGNFLSRHPFLVVTLLVLAVASPAIQNQFVNWDDDLYLSAAAPVHLGLTWQGIQYAFTQVSQMYWHPLTWLSFETDIEIFGTNLHGHHFVSILLHALTAGLLVLLLRRLGAGPYFAVVGSLFWALHPLRVESFAWIAERKDVLFAFFLVAAILLYTRYAENPSAKRFSLWFVCGLSALMSKPTAVVLPVILVLLDWWPLDRIRFSQRLPQSMAGVESPAPAAAAAMPAARKQTSAVARHSAPSRVASLPSQTNPVVAAKTTRQNSRWLPVIDKVPIVLAAAAILFPTISGQGASGATRMLTLSFAMRLSNAVVGYVRYLGKMVWPFDLACLYPFPKSIPLLPLVLSAAILAAITFAAIYQWRRRPWLLMGWLWFVLTLLPNAGLIQAGEQSIADRFTEIPMIGLIIALTWSARELLASRPQWQKPVAWGAVAALALLAALTVRQIGFWQNDETLFGHAIEVEDSATARYNLAMTAEHAGRLAEAEADYKRAIVLRPDLVRHYNNYALLLMREKRLDEALTQAQTAVKTDPNSYLARQTLAQAYLLRGNLQTAFAHYDQAISMGRDPALVARALSDRAAYLARQGQFPEAEQIVRKALTLNPLLPEARRNLVLILISEGRKADARAAFDQAVAATGRLRDYSDLPARLSTR